MIVVRNYHHPESESQFRRFVATGRGRKHSSRAGDIVCVFVRSFVRLCITIKMQVKQWKESSTQVYSTTARIGGLSLRCRNSNIQLLFPTVLSKQQINSRHYHYGTPIILLVTKLLRIILSTGLNKPLCDFLVVVKRQLNSHFDPAKPFLVGRIESTTLKLRLYDVGFREIQKISKGALTGSKGNNLSIPGARGQYFPKIEMSSILRKIDPNMLFLIR